MNEKEFAALKARVAADDPLAMYIYAESIRSADPKEADKYIVLAAHLGNPNAAEKLGDKFAEAGDAARAVQFYRVGARAGLHDCEVKLAVMRFDADEHAALRELERLAEGGVKSACSALASYHKARGNKKEYSFWRSLIR